MAGETDTHGIDDEESSGALRPRAPTSVGSARFIAALTCSPDSEADRPQLKRLLLSALGLVLLFEIVTFFRLDWYEAVPKPAPLLLRVLGLALTAAAVCAVLLMRSTRGWRWWALAFCIALVASNTLMAMAVEEDVPLLMALLVLTLASSVFLPWRVRWQGSLAVISMTACSGAALQGGIEPDDVERWIILGVTTAFAMTFTALKDYYGLQQRMIEELRGREERLRSENAQRRLAEVRLRTEVSERQTAQHLAQDRAATLRKVFEASPDAIIISELAAGRVLDINGKFSASGYRREDVTGRTLDELNIWAEPDQRAEYRARLDTTGQVSNMEADFRNKAGQITECLISGAVVELGDRPCAISIVRDITERKQMERNLVEAREKALAASRAKSEFLSSMSHEIRTPMNAVLGMADLLQETELNPEQRRYLDVMTANGNSLLELINGILDLARIESGRLQIEKTEFELADLIDKTISTFGVRAHGKGLELVARIAPGVPERLVGDALRLRQVLINLLGNAIKFTEKGEVVLEVERELGSNEATEFRFTVSDTGIGIAPDKLGSIFSSFTQADSSTTRKYGGTGLGLAIAERLVGLMDGRIWVESDLNKGSRFSFTARFSLAGRVISPTSHVVLSLSGYRVLVVDDNQINRLIVREMVSNCGAEVSEADSGEAALAAIRQATAVGQPYRIVLLDMRMPGMNGLEVAKTVRQEKLPDPAVDPDALLR